MGLTSSELHEELWSSTGTDSADFDTTVLDRQLNKSWWEIQDKLGFREKEGEGSLTLTAGTQAYEVSTISSDVESIQAVHIQNTGETSWSPLAFKDKRWILDNLDTSSTIEDIPEYYCRYGTELLFSPIPNAAYDVKVTYLKTLDDLISSGFPVPQSWHDPIRLGAEARLWHLMGDPNRRDDAFRFRDALIAGQSEVKVKENVSKVAAIQILRAPYP